MAKKVVVSISDDDDIKKRNKDDGKNKKRSKCCTCCIAILIFLLVVFGAAFGVGYYFGDKYSKEYLGMPLSDTLGVVGGFYWANDKKVVSNPYSPSDVDAFYGELKKNILLKEDADIDFGSSLESALADYLNKGSVNARTANSAANDEGSDSSKGSIVDVFFNMIADVFNEDNIDKARLKEYDDEHDEYIFEIKDKSLAAFIDIMLDAVLKNAQNFKAFDGFSDVVSLHEVVALKQITFRAQTVADEQGNKLSAAAADITVWVGLQKAVGQAIKSFVNDAGFGWAGGIASWLGNILLPKNLYATLTIPLEDGAEPHITINDMNADKRDKLYKIVDGVFSNIMHSDNSVKKLMSSFTDVVKPYLQSAGESIDFSGVASEGKIGFDIIGTLAEMANKNIGETADPLTKADFMYMLQALLTSDAGNMLRGDLEPYLYENWYTDTSGVKSDVYKHDDSVDTTGMERIDYEQEFIKQIERTYSIDFTDGAKLTDVLAELGISLDGESDSMGSETLLDRVNTRRFHESLNDPDIEKLIVTDRMLGAALSDELDKMLTKPGSGFEDISVKLDALGFTLDPDKPGHKYMLLAVELNLAGMIENAMGDSMIVKLATGALPKKMLLSMSIDITLARGEGFEYDDASFKINDYENTDRVLETLKKFVPDLDLNSMTSDIQDMVRDMLDQLDTKLGGIELAAADGLVRSQLAMPDVFTLVSKIVLTDDNGEPIVTAEELKSVLRELDNVDGIDDEVMIAEDYSDFLAEVADVYYLKTPSQKLVSEDNPNGELKTFDDLNTFLSGDFNGSNFRVTADYAAGDPRNVYYMAYDPRPVYDSEDPDNDLTPVLDGNQLGAILMEKTDGDASLDMFDILSITTAADAFTVNMAVEIGSIATDTVNRLLLTDKLFVQATVHVGKNDVTVGPNGKPAYDVNVKINNNLSADKDDGGEYVDENYANMLEIIRFFKSDFDIESQISEFGELMYEQLNNLETSLGGRAENTEEGTRAKSFIKFTDEGVQMPSFYDFLADKLLPETDHPTSDVKNAVQGMYERPDENMLTAYNINSNNYVKSEFMINAPSAEDGGKDEWQSFTPGAGVIGFNSTDRKFNGYIQKVLDDKGNHRVTAMQTAVLTGGDTGTEAMHAVLAGNMVDPTDHADAVLDTANDYLVVTFEMEIGDFSQEQNGNADGFLPHTVYATVAIRKSADDKFQCDGVMFNNMNATAYRLVLELMGLQPEDTADDNTITLASVTRDCVAGLNELCYYDNVKIASIDFAPIGAGSSGIGQLTYSLGA